MKDSVFSFLIKIRRCGLVQTPFNMLTQKTKSTQETSNSKNRNFSSIPRNRDSEYNSNTILQEEESRQFTKLKYQLHDTHLPMMMEEILHNGYDKLITG